MQRANKLVSTLLFVIGIIVSSQAECINFVSENIAVTIFPPDTIQIEGEYFFNTAGAEPANAELYYPFPVE